MLVWDEDVGRGGKKAEEETLSGCGGSSRVLETRANKELLLVSAQRET